MGELSDRDTPPHPTPLRRSAVPPSVSVAQMQDIDRTAIETLGIPRLLLMEHAGLAVARSAQRLAPDTSTGILVCCGMGFNGGDGLAAARHLYDWGYPVQILLTGGADQLRNEPATYATILQRLGLRLQTYDGSECGLAGYGLIIDALLGIGLCGAVREPTASLIHRLNHSGRPIIAVDIPSGLDGDTGSILGAAVRAAVTVTFGLPKRGCLVGDGPAHVGSLIVDGITIPRQLLTPP